MNPTISKETLIEEVSKAAFTGNAAAFVGAGISTPSKLPNWMDLLRPLAEPMGLQIKEEDDLPGIAQYIVNMSAGSRTSLFARIQTAIKQAKAKPNHYHQALARSAIDLVWTTNYDDLLELAYPAGAPVVHSRDTDIAHHHEPGRREIIKAHGCINRSSADELVITREDFEDYFVRHPLMAERLRNDLQRKTFLFAGYGYGDPNIASILVEARRLAHKVPKQRYMLQRKADSGKAPDAIQRQQQWVMDLRRVGIHCAVVDNFDEYAAVLDSIALRSRGPTMYVTGGHVANSKLAEDVGRELAKRTDVSVVLFDGQSTGASRNFIQAFVHQAAKDRIDFRERIRYFANPYAQVPALSNDPQLLPRLKEWRAEMLRSANTVLAFDGGMGTRAEVELAADLGCNILLVAENSAGSSTDLARIAHIRKLLPDDNEYLTSTDSGIPMQPAEIIDLALRKMPGWSSW
ncbi:UNVERIFIED_ORG: hypothetical protein GGI63_006206 [Rhizobium esperanzae]|nr:hypothetical protein RHECNPAF_337004 [Rhizobium etli CNPAF512]